MGFTYDKREYAASTWTLERMPLYDALKAFQQYGFRDVEIWADTVHLDPRVNPDIHQVQNWLREFHQDVHSIHAPFRNYNPRPSEEKEFRELRVSMYKKTIDYAQALECGILVVHAVDRNEYNYERKDAEIVRAYIDDIARYGKARGVKIAIEDIAPGNDPEEIQTTLRRQTEMFADLDVCYCLDIGHVPLLGADMRDEISAAGKKLITLHIHNNCGKTDDHNLPNDGVLDWPAIHDNLRSRGYAGKFVLEIYGGRDAAQEAALLDRMNGLFGG